METRLTYCRICEALCGLEVDVEDGEVVAVRPDKEHPLTQGYCCVKGVSMDKIHRDPDRLLYPQKRMPSGRFERVSWKQALSEIGVKVRALRKEYGRHAVGFYLGNPAAFSYAHGIFSQAFVRALGTRNLYTAGSQDCNNKFVVAKELFGSSLIQGIPDFENLRYFLCIGSNPAISQMSFVHAPRPIEQLRAVERRGGRVVFVGPRRIESQKTVGEHVLIRPDTDVYFLAALLHVFEREGWIWTEGVSKYARGLSDLLAVTRPFTPEKVARITGVPPEKIERIARDFAAAPGAGAYCSTGVNQGSSGTLAYWFLNALNFVSGNLDRRGGMMVANYPVDMPGVMKRLGAEESHHRSRIGGFSQVLGSLPGTILADEILTPGEGRIRAMFVTAGNPVLSCPNSERLGKAFEELELLVSLDIYRNETGELAHYLLPTTDFLQRDDFPLPFSGLQPVPFLQYTEAVAAPKGEQRQEWEIYVDLAKACGVPLFGARAADIGFRLARLPGKFPGIGNRVRLEPKHLLASLLALSKTSLEELKRNPHGKLMPPNAPGSFLGKRVLTADKRINLAPSVFVAEGRELLKKYERQLTQIEGNGELLLFSKRERFTHNTWMHNIPEFVRGERKTNYAYLNPADAEKRGISEGQDVAVSNRWGRIVLPARLTDDVIAGAVAVPHGWGHKGATGLRVAGEAAGANVNTLAPDGSDHTERLSGMAHFNGVPVSVEPA